MAKMMKPSRKDYELPLLRAIADLGGAVSVPSSELEHKVAAFLDVEDAEWDKTHARPVWVYQLQWVRYNLVRSGELDGSVRGVWKITERGRERLAKEWGEWRPPVAVLSAERIEPQATFYTLAYQDILDVAAEVLERPLTDGEIHEVAERVCDAIPWHEIVRNAVSAVAGKG